MNRSTSPTGPSSGTHASAPSSLRPGRRTAIGLGLALPGLATLPGLVDPAVAAPPSPDVPAIRPTPQSVTTGSGSLRLAGRVSVIVGEGTDAVARQALVDLLESADCKPRLVTATGAEDDVHGARIHLGTPEDNPALAAALDALGAEGPADLAADGYVLAAGKDGGPHLALAGRDARGTFYAVQTLRQLLAGGASLPALTVRDAPLMEIRGAIEGFYGIPWSHEARKDLFAFSGEHKLNTYIYTPKDDLLLRAQWRDLYEGEELDRLRELVETANAHHVTFTFALSPGNDITYGSEDDLQATITKFEQLRQLGVDSFYIALDDIPTELGEEDAAQFGSLAAAQAHYLNRVQDEYVRAHDLAPLQTVPTEYWGSGPSDYKTTFGEDTDPDVRIQWTGEGVFSPSVTEESVVAAVESYRTDHLYIWDNFPVNDGRRDRLFLNPLEGRDPSLHEHLAGFTANPMIQPYASLISLGNYADYCWNPPSYDAAQSWDAVVDELAGPDEATRAALRDLTDLHQNWPYRDGSPQAPALGADVDAYWAASAAGGAPGTALGDRLTRIAGLEDALAGMACAGFLEDVRPWVVAGAQWAQGLLEQHAMLAALAAGDHEEASAAAARAVEQFDLAGRATVPDQREDGVHKEDQIVPSVGDGRVEVFVSAAWEILRAELPDDPSLPFRGLPATASTTMGTYRDYAPARMVDGDLGTFYWSSRAPKAGDEIRADLGAVHPLRFARVQMAKSDGTPGDQIHSGVLELSEDGDSWTEVGRTDGTPVLEVRLEEARPARYARVRVTAPNPGGQWVQVRELGLGETAPAA
ncbi:beta-N-acetylglucosaminidase domain-containing protein [Brachybacterium sp. NBEC-018]|uniref:beta-N-acetylglucosaminidase domain-containing protein n=1 Tax=Brachybacterium sp. NBEC-018 TaxID=2996004 RepID=UPI0021756575|nr:beta-N-acetylglucosaminidase domain-containing protein [Brachybacterium sp. NBEC-018]UVY84741.1 beta-N-acetylglucosaminidase domain-containing protein [Brachybacterium sp. NBEC-018]